MNRLAEIAARKLEIRELLQNENEKIDLAAIKTELEQLEQEENAINERREMAEKINKGTVSTNTIQEKKEDNTKVNIREKLLNGQTVNLSEVREHGVTEGESTVNSVGMSFEEAVVKKLNYISPLYAKVRKIRTASPHQFTIQNGKIGKFVKTAELANYVQQHATFATKVANAYKYTNLVAFSKEIMEDAVFDIEGELRDQLAEALAETYNSLIVTGDADVEGLLKATGAEEVSPVANGKIATEDIINVFYGLPVAYRDNACWIINDNTAKELAKLKDGMGQPLLYVSYNASPVGPTSMILGKPVIIDNNMPDLFTGDNAIVFADLDRAIVVAERTGVEVVRSTEFGFLNDSIAIKANVRLDIKLMQEEAIAYFVSE